MTLDLLSKRLGVPLRKALFRRYVAGTGREGGVKVVLAKPLTFMNNSGDVFDALVRLSGASSTEIVVVCDNLDLPPGACRLKLRGSSAGQRGLQSIIERAGTDEIARLFIGIGRPAAGSVIDHVLGTPPPEEAGLLASAVARAAEAVVKLLTTPPDQVMNEINRRSRDPSGES